MEVLDWTGLSKRFHGFRFGSFGLIYCFCDFVAQGPFKSKDLNFQNCPIYFPIFFLTPEKETAFYIQLLLNYFSFKSIFFIKILNFKKQILFLYISKQKLF